MAFPTVIARNTDAQNTNATSFVIDVPGFASRQSGDIAVICIVRDGSGAFTGTFPPTGYTSGDNQATSTTVRAAWFWRRMTGDGNDASTVTVTFGTSENWLSRGWLLRGCHSITNPVSSTVTGTTGTAADLPALNPATWDVEDTIWLAYVGLDGNSAVSAFPGSYGNTGSNVTSDGTTGNRVAQGYCERTNAVASEDPGAFTITSGADFRGYLIAVRPAAGANLTATASFASGDATVSASAAMARDATAAFVAGEVSASASAQVAHPLTAAFVSSEAYVSATASVQGARTASAEFVSGPASSSATASRGRAVLAAFQAGAASSASTATVAGAKTLTASFQASAAASLALVALGRSLTASFAAGMASLSADLSIPEKGTGPGSTRVLVPCGYCDTTIPAGPAGVTVPRGTASVDLTNG